MRRSSSQGVLVGQVTIRRQPGKNGYQGGIEVAGQVLGVA
jgi:hypothetical protein